jgi:hypothetical protein
MDDFEKAEFWAGLNRLHTKLDRFHTELEVLRQETEALKETAFALVETAHSHERRLDRSEVLIEALLEDMRRYRLSVAGIDETSKVALETSIAVEKRLETMLEEWKRRREGNTYPRPAIPRLAS